MADETTTMTEPPTTRSIEEVYQPYHEEIRRREATFETMAGQNQMTFDRASEDEVPFKLDGQSHFVWSASHARMPPLALSDKQPAVRVYGVFASAEEAFEHAQTVSALDPTCSVLVSQTHEWVVLPKDVARLQDPDGARAHVDAVLATYAAAREKSAATFQKNVAEHRTGVGPEAKAEEEEAPRVEDLSHLKMAPQRIGRDAEVRDQSVVAVTFVRDETGGDCPEPIFRVYAAFESTKEGDAWARCAGDHVVEYDIDLCSTCAWLFPNAVDSEKVQKQIFRPKELTAIMQNQKAQPQKVENFRKWRDEATSSEC